MQMDLIADSLVFITSFGLIFILLPSQGIQIFLVSNFLFLLGDIDGSQVLLKFSLIDAVFIFHVFESDLCFFLKLSKLVQILED